MKLRIGHGIDAHRFSQEKKLFLGGLEIENHPGLEGHSDGDALIHAICDAILGALCLGDIGLHFSDKDPKWKGADSKKFLEEMRYLLKEKKATIANIDTTVVTESPILRPYIDEMRGKIAFILDLKEDQVSIKATRPEKMGALGQKEGLVAFATVLISF